jgi:hypothetical protein
MYLSRNLKEFKLNFKEFKRNLEELKDWEVPCPVVNSSFKEFKGI